MGRAPIDLWPLEGTSGQKGAAHLVSLVDAVDKLGAGGTPGQTNRGGVDGFGLHVSWRHSRYWENN